MKHKIILVLVLVLALMVFPSVDADVIIPTITTVYFEQNGQPYNSKVEFTVIGYGYSLGIPGSPGYVGEKQPGTYTPEDVFSFSAVYDNYGDKIYEDYYINYRHIDYYGLEGKTADGKIFAIQDIKEIPSKCEYVQEIDRSLTDKEGNPLERVCELRFNLDNVEWGGEITPEPNPESISESNGFWVKLACFFKGLFSRSC